MGKPNKQTENVSDPAWTAKIAQRIALIAGLSTALGLAFNASNPIGLRWSAPAATDTAVAPNVTPSVVPVPQASVPPPPPVPTLAKSITPPPSIPAVQRPPLGEVVPGFVSESSKVAIPGISIQPPAPPTPVVNPTLTAGPTTPANPPATSTPTTWVDSKSLVQSGQAILIDARPKPSYDAGHIPGAISFPESSTPDEFAALQKKYDPSSLLIVYCSSESCSMSKRLADRFMRDFGFRNARYITGGYQEWQRIEGLASAAANPLVPSAPPPVSPVPAPIPAPAPTPVVPPVVASTTTPISWTDAKPLVEGRQVVLIDARPKAVYDAGHIPGAISLPESSSAEELIGFQKAHSPSQQLVVYCGSQSCSLSKRLADKLAQEYGFRTVRYMTGGYQEWQRAQLPDTKPGI